MTRILMRMFLALALGVATPALARTLYLNGTDISSARNQTLQGVNVRIDGGGNIFIEAPHYQVHEENTYTPLSQWHKEERNQPASKLPDNLTKVTPPAEKVEPPKTEPVKTEASPTPPAATNSAAPTEKPVEEGKKAEE